MLGNHGKAIFTLTWPTDLNTSQGGVKGWQNIVLNPFHLSLPWNTLSNDIWNPNSLHLRVSRTAYSKNCSKFAKHYFHFRSILVPPFDCCDFSKCVINSGIIIIAGLPVPQQPPGLHHRHTVHVLPWFNLQTHVRIQFYLPSLCPLFFFQISSTCSFLIFIYLLFHFICLYIAVS